MSLLTGHAVPFFPFRRFISLCAAKSEAVLCGAAVPADKIAIGGSDTTLKFFHTIRTKICSLFQRNKKCCIIFSIALPAFLLSGIIYFSYTNHVSDSSEEPPVSDSASNALDATTAAQPSQEDSAAEELPEPEPEAPPEPVLNDDSLLAIVDQYADEYNAVNISAAVVENGEVTASCGWGMADLGGRAMTKDTKIRCASISKVVVALCAMRMAQDGLVNLDDSISNYWGVDISSRSYPDVPISLELLLTHTSTISELTAQRSLSAAASSLSQHPFTGEKPGSIWRYSNYGSGVIGLTLEQAYGNTLEEYVQSYFLKPMGIDGSFYTASFSAEELASLYRGTTNEWSAANQAATRLPQGIGDAMSFFCGNFTSSAGDYAKLIALLANDGTYDGVFYLSPEAIADMETPRLAANNGESDFQQCLTLRRKENVYGQEILYYHTGSAYGVYALASYNPITRNGVVVISSGANRSIDEEGIYGLCASISKEAYRQIDAGKGTI